MSKNDYVIICGDFGGVWDGTNEEKYWIKWLKNKNFTTLFIDGNHENFDMLYNLSMVEFGGRIAKSCLFRKKIYTIFSTKHSGNPIIQKVEARYYKVINY